MVKATSAFVATTLLASSAMAWESAATTTTTTTKPVDPATTDAPWLDWTSSTTTSKEVDPVKSTTTTVDPWLDWTSSTTTSKKVDPVKSTSTSVDPWADWASTTTTSKKVDPAKTTSTTHVWADWTSSSVKPVDPAVTASTWAPVDPAVCAAVTVTYTGAGFWVPDPAGAWADWTSSSSTTKKVDPAKSTSTTWADWEVTTTKKVDPAKSTSTTVDPTWSDWVASTTTTLKTVVSTTTKPAATTTGTKPPSAAPTCPSDNKKSVLAGGSCGCSFTVNCGVKASPDASSLFWEKTSGGIVPTLAECLALCDSNDKCEAALWVDDATNGDYHHCWQISGLGAPTGEGVAQISYKGTCSGKCSESYTKA
ncbi:uncharacterized protein A1O9_06022 [Exophiala aquamarina CBS 119918]|uniref:Apple domain-containing protein n=1 Tax=Exophiala aquamarina CBS 119918 TaxID=1182545 RepID=A0A072PDB4_9EURO|nr:uncharacterized protein A1O9_06022 [Exophiala aquamarina CBS 119918]KEF58099.1 hypothetical protein A1O9_06022 [Exophiala aquamarina CBS 119918]